MKNVDFQQTTIDDLNPRRRDGNTQGQNIHVFKVHTPPSLPRAAVSDSTFQIYPGLVNRERVIQTLEDKANITGFRWKRPKRVQKGFIEKRSKNGAFLHYSQKEPVKILDVDGREKHTIKEMFFEADTVTVAKATTYGEWIEGLAGKYHGRNSRNWKQENLILPQIVDILNAGYAFAPGFFDPPDGESHRSGNYCEHRQIILLDGDEWSSEHPAPSDLSELISSYPDLATDFFWVGESISSRSSLKPELRTRLMLVLPKPIYKGQTELWESTVDAIVSKYPFIARGVGIDKVRLSFGNARPECENKVLGGLVSLDTFHDWERIASEKQAKTETLRIENERKKAESKARREKDTALKKELVRRGHTVVENKDPISEFCGVDAETLLIDLGLASRLSGDSWHWHDSSPGRSFEITNGVIKPFSNTMQSASPESDSTKPVNAHRYILYYQHKLDMTKDSDKRQLRCILADQDYGTHPDVYKQAKRAEKLAAVREGLLSPLELRAAAKPLPKERHKRVLQTLQQNAKEIAKVFKQAVRVVGLQAGTGEGKTEQAVSFAVSGGSVAMCLNTTPLAEQVYSRFDKAETNAFLWRSRWFGYGSSESDRKKINLIPLHQRIRDFERGNVLCIKPHLCKKAQDKGVPAPVAVCSTCELQSKCRSDGYLSQTPTAQKTQVLCIAQPKLFLDPLHRGFFRELSRGQPKERVCVIDEAKVHELFIECALSKAVLQQWGHDWEGESLGDFAKEVLTMLEVDPCSPYEIAEKVAGYSDEEIQALSRQASRFRVPYKKLGREARGKNTLQIYANHSVEFENGKFAYVAVDFDAHEALLERDLPVLQPQEISEKGFMLLTPAQAFNLGVYELEDIDGGDMLPRLWEQSNWTPFQQLKQFIERYPREEDAPIWYHDSVLHWVIPPVVHSRVKYLVCMSATLQREGFERAFDSVPTTFIETSPTHWVEGAKAYQVRTGAYPRTSLLQYTDDWKEVVGLSKSGERFLKSIEKEVARDTSIKHVLITVKAIVDLCGKQLTEKHKNLNILSFHKMEGLDFTECGVVVWVLGCPNVKKTVVWQRAKVLYGNDDNPLNYEYDKDSGEYVDPRVQQCWLSEVVARLQQAVGRARLNRLANTVIVFSNVLIPDFTSRAVGFVPEDIEVAVGLSNLENVAVARLEAEKDAPEKHKETRADRETKTRTARDMKAEQKNEVYRLYNSGITKSKIAQKTGVSRPTIDKWLKEFRF